MIHDDPRVCLEQLVHRYRLRWTQRTKCFLGLHRGIVVDACEREGILTIMFSSPTAEVGELVLTDFDAFAHCAEAGLPTAWIKGRMEVDGVHARVSDHSCSFWIDQRRMAEIGYDLFIRIPDIIADDLHARGASGTMRCAACGTNEATAVGLLEYTYTPLCDTCRDRALRGEASLRLLGRRRVDWRRVLPLLAVVTGAGAYGWGYIQQPQRLDQFSWVAAMLLPVAWAFGLCWVIYWRRIPVTRTLRVLLFGSVIASVLIGNIWGFRSRMIDQARQQFNQQVTGPGWPTSVKLYFSALPQSWKWEAPFLLEGLVGAWIALRTLKRPETLDVQ